MVNIALYKSSCVHLQLFYCAVCTDLLTWLSFLFTVLDFVCIPLESCGHLRIGQICFTACLHFAPKKNKWPRTNQISAISSWPNLTVTVTSFGCWELPVWWMYEWMGGQLFSALYEAAFLFGAGQSRQDSQKLIKLLWKWKPWFYIWLLFFDVWYLFCELCFFNRRADAHTGKSKTNLEQYLFHNFEYFFV